MIDLRECGNIGAGSCYRCQPRSLGFASFRPGLEPGRKLLLPIGLLLQVSLGVQMSSLQQRAAAVIDERLNLVALLRELERLREQVRKAELARSPRVDRRKRTRIRWLELRSRLRGR